MFLIFAYQTDGSQALLYYYEGEWHVSSKKTPDGTEKCRSGSKVLFVVIVCCCLPYLNQSFAELFWEIIKEGV